jgi:hypothetical protein
MSTTFSCGLTGALSSAASATDFGARTKPIAPTISRLPSRQCHAGSRCPAFRLRIFTFVFFGRDRFARAMRVTSFATDSVPIKQDFAKKNR